MKTLFLNVLQTLKINQYFDNIKDQIHLNECSINVAVRMCFHNFEKTLPKL